VSTKSTYIYSEDFGFHLYQEALDYGRIWLELKKEHTFVIWVGKTKIESDEEIHIGIPKEVWNEIIKLGPREIPKGYHNFDPTKKPDVFNGFDLASKEASDGS
jgi:hypothetical protein